MSSQKCSVILTRGMITFLLKTDSNSFSSLQLSITHNQSLPTLTIYIPSCGPSSFHSLTLLSLFRSLCLHFFLHHFSLSFSAKQFPLLSSPSPSNLPLQTNKTKHKRRFPLPSITASFISFLYSLIFIFPFARKFVRVRFS